MEFSVGINATNNYIKNSNFPVVITNIRDKRVNGAKRSHVIRIQEHLIGFVAYLRAITKRIRRPDNIEFTDEINEIISEVGFLKALGVKTIIALGNTDLEKDLQILHECQQIDLVISGHEKFYWNGASPKRESKKPDGPYPLLYERKSGTIIPILTVPPETKYLGRLEITINTQNGRITSFHGNPVFLDGSVPLDAEVVQALEGYEGKMNKIRRHTLGHTTVTLETSDEVCKKRECTLGNMVTDALVDYAADKYSGEYWTNAAIAMTSTSIYIGKDIKPGIIKESYVYESIPFRGDIIVVSMRGKYLLEVLLHAVHRYPTNQSASHFYGNEFLQHSGLIVTYDLRKVPKRRLSYVFARCAQCLVPTYDPIVKSQYYNIVMTDILYSGIDGYYWFKEHGEIVVKYKVKCYVILKAYLSNHKPIFPVLEERITLISSTVMNSATVLTLIPVICLIFLKL